MQILKYGSAGVENLGQLVDGPGVPVGTALGYSTQSFTNYNAADINPATGELIAGNVRSGTYLNGANQLTRLLRIDVTTSPPQLLGFIQLTTPIPVRKSGDFAIDATGTYAYGIAVASDAAQTQTWWRADLTTGAVTTKLFGNGDRDFGSAALLPDGNVAFYSNEDGRVTVVDTEGNIVGFGTAPIAASSDGARCLPAPVVTLVCDPTALVDADGNVSTCTVTSDQPAPVGGWSIALTLPATSDRYTTDCTSPLVIADGETTATCTITAAANTAPGDGSVDAALAIAEGEGYALGDPVAATVTISDDDGAVTPATVTSVPTLSEWGLMLLSLGVAGFAFRRRRR